MPATIAQFRTASGVVLIADCYRHDAPSDVVLLLHGGGQNRHAWTRTARQLHRMGYTVIAYDARGHGDSSWDPDGCYEIDVLAADLLAIREQMNGDRAPAVVGASLGGMTILGAHLQGPADLWSAVILVDITPRMEFDGAHRVLSFMAAHPEGFHTLADAAAVIADYNPHRARPDTVDGLRKVLRQRDDGRWIWRWDPAFVTWAFQFFQADPTTGAGGLDTVSELLVEGARRVQAPTLLVRGVHSDVTSQQSVEEFRDVIPHAKTIDVSGTGHMVAGDDNDAFTVAVADFLGRKLR